VFEPKAGSATTALDAAKISAFRWVVDATSPSRSA
jgi:hypothetical protein